MSVRRVVVGDDVENSSGKLFRFIEGPDELTIQQEQFDDSLADVGDFVNLPLIVEGQDRLDNAIFRRIG